VILSRGLALTHGLRTACKGTLFIVVREAEQSVQSDDGSLGAVSFSDHGDRVALVGGAKEKVGRIDVHGAKCGVAFDRAVLRFQYTPRRLGSGWLEK